MPLLLLHLADFTYNQTIARLALPLPTIGRVHAGFANVAASLWPSVRSALHSLVKDRSTGTTVKHVYVAGHSLGAGVATLLSFAVQVCHSLTQGDWLLLSVPGRAKLFA